MRILGEEYVVIRGVDLEKEEQALPFRDARSRIALWIRDPQVWPVLLDMCDTVLGTEHPNPTLMGLEWVHYRLLDAFERGRLLLVGEEEDEPGAGGSKSGGGGGGGGGGGSNPADGPAPGGPAPKPPAPADPAPPKEPVKTWFQAKLLDEDGEPMAGEDYIVVDTDGVKRKGKLDAKGEMKIPAILPPGKCSITFPNIHLNPRKRKG